MIQWIDFKEQMPEAEDILVWVVDHDDGDMPMIAVALRLYGDHRDWEPSMSADVPYFLPDYMGRYTFTHWAPHTGPDGKPIMSNRLYMRRYKRYSPEQIADMEEFEGEKVAELARDSTARAGDLPDEIAF